MTNRRVWLALLSLIFMGVTLGIYLSVASTKADLHGTEIDSPPNVQDVELIGYDNKPYTLAEWEGKLVLVFFGYANCPDVCPLTMAKLAKTYRELGSPDDLRIVMVTVDPQRDTPKRVVLLQKSLQAAMRGFATVVSVTQGVP